MRILRLPTDTLVQSVIVSFCRYRAGGCLFGRDDDFCRREIRKRGGNDRLRRGADCGGYGNKGFFGGEDRVVDGLNGRRNRSTCFALVNDQ